MATKDLESGSFRFVRGVLRPLLAVTTRHAWRGLHHIPREGGCVVVANHISYFDPVVVGQFLDAAGRAPRFLGKAKLFELPVLGTLLTHAGQIPVHRETVDAARALDAAVAAVAQRQCVVIYPEGTLTRDPELWPMNGKTGAARVALATGCPVVPVAHWGAQHILAKGQKLPRLLPPKPVSVWAGEPVDLTRLQGNVGSQPGLGQGSGESTPDALREATAAIMEDITGLLRQIRCEDGRVDKQASDRDGAS